MTVGLLKVFPRYGEWAYRSHHRNCGQCGELLPLQKHQGNPRKWCSESCRVKAYRARRAAA
ncbi:hypothetical protein RKD30_002399 [Streptomyces pristinaespiralis]